MNFETSRIIDCNGSKYRVGWDEHGWFTLQAGEMYEGEFHTYEDQRDMNFPPDAADEIIEAIEEGQ